MTVYFEKLVRANFRFGRMRSCCCPLTNNNTACAVKNYQATTGANYVRQKQTSF